MKKTFILILCLLISCSTVRTKIQSFNGQVYYFTAEEATETEISFIKRFNFTEDYFGIYINDYYFAIEGTEKEILIYKIIDEESRRGVVYTIRR